MNLLTPSSICFAISLLISSVGISVGFARQASASMSPDTPPQAILLTAHVPPYVAPLGNGIELVSDKVEGILVDTVTSYLRDQNISYDLAMLPWSAAYRRVLATRNALIFPLDRTPSREEKFRWIKELYTHEYFIYGVTSSSEIATSTSDIIRLNGQVSCTLNSIQCELLVENGLPEENILRLEGASIPDRYRLLERNRNQYSIFDPVVLDFLLIKHQLDKSKLTKLFKAGEKKSYLAISTAASQELVDALLR